MEHDGPRGVVAGDQGERSGVSPDETNDQTDKQGTTVYTLDNGTFLLIFLPCVCVFDICACGDVPLDKYINLQSTRFPFTCLSS